LDGPFDLPVRIIAGMLSSFPTFLLPQEGQTAPEMSKLRNHCSN
jgi:hypothetical protein